PFGHDVVEERQRRTRGVLRDRVARILQQRLDKVLAVPCATGIPAFEHARENREVIGADRLNSGPCRSPRGGRCPRGIARARIASVALISTIADQRHTWEGEPGGY